MQEAIEDRIVELSVPADVAEHIERAEKWAGEPFVHPGEDPERVLAEGTARRRALDDAIAELDAGERVPTPKWKVRYGLMLGSSASCPTSHRGSRRARSSAATRSTRSREC